MKITEKIQEDMISGKIISLDCPFCQEKDSFKFVRNDNQEPCLGCKNCGFLPSTWDLLITLVKGPDKWIINIEANRKRYQKEILDKIKSLKDEIKDLKLNLEKIQKN